MICTDKTGTLTENRDARRARLDPAGRARPRAGLDGGRRSRPTRCSGSSAGRSQRPAPPSSRPGGPGKSRARRPRSACSSPPGCSGSTSPSARREHARQKLFHFDPKLRLMSTVDERATGSLTVHAKGAPEEVLARATDDRRPRTTTPAHRRRPRGGPRRARALRAAGPARPRGRAAASDPDGATPPSGARTPSRSSACSASSRCSTRPARRLPRPSAAATQAGIRILVVTGDYGPTAAEIARRVGIGRRRRGSSPASSSTR